MVLAQLESGPALWVAAARGRLLCRSPSAILRPVSRRARFAEPVPAHLPAACAAGEGRPSALATRLGISFFLKCALRASEDGDILPTPCQDPSMRLDSILGPTPSEPFLWI